MKIRQLTKAIFFSIAFLACFINCTKDNISKDGSLSSVTVKLKSLPGELNTVFIEIKDVELRVKDSDNAPSAWISLNAINIGTYNASDLIEDSKLLLVDNFEIVPTYIYEIRLVLGDNNFIDLDNTLHSLDVSNLGNSIPSNELRLELLQNHFYDFVINIDIDKSVSFNEDENMMVLIPEIYTEIRQIQY